MLVGLCNAPATFYYCLMFNFFDMVVDTIEVFMDDILDVGDSFDDFLAHLTNVLWR